jgi:hypothetical protein
MTIYAQNREEKTMKNALQIARNYPVQAAAILSLIRLQEDKQTLKDLLGSCTCTRETLACTCPPEYSAAKLGDFTGHSPKAN